MNTIPKSYDHGFNNMDRINPTGNNYAANFVRGATYYFSDEQSAKRKAEIDVTYEAWKQTKR